MAKKKKINLVCIKLNLFNILKTHINIIIIKIQYKKIF